MEKAVAPQHYSSEDLAMYFRQILSRLEAEALERHLSDCDICTFRARREYALSAAVGRWCAEVHSVALMRGTMRQGLLAAAAVEMAEVRAHSVEWGSRRGRFVE